MAAFIVLMFGYMLSQFDRGFLAIVAGDLRQDLGLDASALALVSAAWFAAFALGQVPTGVALDRFGPRRTVAGFMIAAVVGAAWLANASGFVDVLGAMVLIGFGCAPALMGPMYLFGRVYPLERFAMLSSLMIGLGTLGDVFGASPLAYLAERFGWRPLMLGLACATTASALSIVGVVRDPPRVVQAPGASLLGGFVEVARIGALRRILPIVFVSYAVVIATRSLWSASYLEAVHGFGRLAQGNGVLAMSVAMALGAVGYGPLERLVRDPQRTALAGCIVTGLAFVALGAIGDRSDAVAIGLLALVGGAGLTYAILMAHARRFFPARLLGRGVAFMNIAFMAGGSAVQACSALFVHAQQAAGQDPATTYARMFLAFGLVVLVASAVYATAPDGRGEAAR